MQLQCRRCKQNKPATLEFFNASHLQKNHWCRECKSAQDKAYVKNNPEKVKAIRKKAYQDNREEILAKQKEYQAGRKEEIASYMTSYWEKNKAKLKEYRTNWRYEHWDERKAQHQERYDNDPTYKLLFNTRNRVRTILKDSKASKDCGTLELLGGDLSVARAHIESLFKPGMTWDNHGMTGWHIDHIKPISSFDLSDPAQLKECFHYTNLQPLWAEENLSKGAKID